MKTFFIYLFCVMMLKAGAGQFHEGDIIITNVHVIDVETGEVIESKDVIIAGDKIASIVEHRVGRSFHGEVIDGSGKYLIPGLWDMHVHSRDDDLTRSVVLPLYVAHGVTHISYASDPVIRNDPRQRHLPPGWWDPEGVAEWLDSDRHLRPTYEHRLRSIPDLYRAGIGILAGTDMLGGFPLHNELALFVDAGLTPLEALRTATLNPARYLKATDSLGTVEVGKLTDLVLLDANPLEDITNTQKIHAVMANGRYFDRKELDELLEQVERAAKDKNDNKLKHKR